MMQTIIHTIDFHTSSPVVLSRRLGRKKNMDLREIRNGHLDGEHEENDDQPLDFGFWGTLFSEQTLRDGAPKIAFSWFISGLTMVYGKYNYS